MANIQSIIKQIKDVSKDFTVKSEKPMIGKMYAYIYDPKTKDKLPYYDTVPLVIPISYSDNGYYGINFHYLDLTSRNKLLNLMIPFNRGNKDIKKMQINYSVIKGLSNSLWQFCCKRYLWTHIVSKVITIPFDDWNTVINLPIANFMKQDTRYIYKQYRKRRKVS